MGKICLRCGGTVKAFGTGFKCPSCGTIYENEQELTPPPRIRKAPKTATTAAIPEPVAPPMPAPVAVPAPEPVAPPVPAPTADRAAATSEPSPKSITPPPILGGADIFDKNINGVLEITWKDDKFRHSGSGFLIDRNGYAITNAHVVTYDSGEAVGKVDVKICDVFVTAEVVLLGDDKHGTGNGDDLALIKLSRVPDEATAVQLGDSEHVKNGDNVYVIGNSLGYGTCITRGIISDRHRKMRHRTLLMTDCAINGGNSGGPMFNEQGNVIGAVCSGIDGAEGMNYAIPSNCIMAFLDKANAGTAPALRNSYSAVCPRCRSSSVNIENGIRYCTACDYEW